MVCEMKLRNAAQRLEDIDCLGSWAPAKAASGAGDCKPVAICAIFLANLSLSALSSFSFRFIAPGLCLRLLCLMTLTWLLVGASSPASGSASARESRLVTSFFDGRRRLRGLFRDFSIFETNAECLIMRLSFFELWKSELAKPVASAWATGLFNAADLAVVLGRMGA